MKNEYYLPAWENDKLWKKQYEYHVAGKRFESENEWFKKQYLNFQDFRKYCYKEATTAFLSGYSHCSSSAGWCFLCARGEDWSR